MTTLQRIQDNVSSMALNTKASIQRNTQHAKSWVNQNIAPHSSKIAIATGALAATVISTIVLRNFLTNSTVPQTPPSNPTNSSQNQSIDCGYYFDNRYVLAITDACANYTRPVVDFATNLVSNFTTSVTNQDVCNLFDAANNTLVGKPVVILTNSSLNASTKQAVNPTLNDFVDLASLAVNSNISNIYTNVCGLDESTDVSGFFDSVDHSPVVGLTNSSVNASTTQVVADNSSSNLVNSETPAANLSSNDTAKVINNVSNVSSATNSSSNSSTKNIWDSLAYGKDKTAEFAARVWNSTKVFASDSAYPTILNFAAQGRGITSEYVVSTQNYLTEFAKTHNITAESAYQKFEAANGITIASVASYYTAKSATEALRVILLTSSKINKEGETYFNFAKTLLDIFNSNYHITSKEQLNSLIEILKEEPNRRGLNLEIIFNNYKGAVKNKNFVSRDIAIDNFSKITNCLKDLMIKKLTNEQFNQELLTIDSTRKDSNSIQLMLNSFKNLLTRFYSEKKEPGTSYTATAVAGVAALVTAVVSARFTGLV